MTKFKSLFVFAFVFMVTGQAQALPQMTAEQIRIYEAKMFVEGVARDFQSFRSPKSAKLIYGMLYSKKFRAKMTAWPDQFTVKADGTTLTFESPGQTTIRLEVVDLFRQQYKINGKKFVHDYKTDPLVEAEVLSRMMQHRGHALNDFLIPKSEAFPLIFVLLGLAIVEGSPVAIALGATLDAALVTLAGDAALLTGRAALTRSATTATESIGKAALQELRSDPALRAELLKELLGDAIKGPAVKAGGHGTSAIKTLAWTTAIGLPTYLSLQERADRHKLEIGTMISCWRLGEDLDKCSLNQQSKKIKTPALFAKQNWCFSGSAHEVQGYVDMEKGKKEVSITKVGEAEVGQKSDPFWGMRFVVDRDGVVDRDSIRTFDVEMKKTNGGKEAQVVQMRQVFLKKDSVLYDTDMFPPRDAKLLDEPQAKDMADKIVNRDLKLKEATDRTHETITPKDLSDYRKNISGTKAENKNSDDWKSDEFSAVTMYEAAYRQVNAICEAIDTIDTKSAQAAAVPGSESAITPVK